jgi:hypothetical protein
MDNENCETGNEQSVGWVQVMKQSAIDLSYGTV